MAWSTNRHHLRLLDPDGSVVPARCSCSSCFMLHIFGQNFRMNLHSSALQLLWMPRTRANTYFIISHQKKKRRKHCNLMLLLPDLDPASFGYSFGMFLLINKPNQQITAHFLLSCSTFFFGFLILYEHLIKSYPVESCESKLPDSGASQRQPPTPTKTHMSLPLTCYYSW